MFGSDSSSRLVSCVQEQQCGVVLSTDEESTGGSRPLGFCHSIGRTLWGRWGSVPPGVEAAGGKERSSL